MITAIFQADFSNFQKSLETAETRLRTFESNTQKVDSTLAKFGNKFSGVKIVQDALAMEKAIQQIGGAAMLTEKELIDVGNKAQAALDKLKALGQEGPQGLKDLAAAGKEASASIAGTGGAGGGGISGALGSVTKALGPLGPMMAATFSIGAVVGFAKEIGAFAGQMVDLSDQTGIAVEDLQALDYVAAGAGLTIEDITGSVAQLSNRLAGGDKSAAAAMGQLGLNTHALLAQSPDKALIAIAEAVGQIANPMERTALAMDLFGKSGPKMLRIMTDELGGLIDEAKTSGAVIDEELIRRADKFDDAWTQAIKKVKGLLATMVLGPSIEDKRANLDRMMAARDAARLGGDEAALGVSDRQLAALADEVNASDVGKMLAGLGTGPKYKGAGGATPNVPIDFAAGLAGITAAVSPEEKSKRKAAASEAEAEEKRRQKAIADRFGQKPPTPEELERLLFGFTADEASAITREHARLMAAPAYVIPGDTSRGGDVSRPLLATGLTAAGAAKNDAERQQLIAQMYKPPDLSTIGTIENLLPKKAAESFASTFGGTLKSKMGPAIIGAIQGGGDVKKTIIAQTGGALADSLFKADGGIMKSLTGKDGMIGKVLGGVASFIPMIGPLIGPAIQGVTALVGKLFGSEAKEVKKKRDAFVKENFGNEEEFRKLAKEAGIADVEIAKLYSTKKVKDFEAAAARVNEKLDRFAKEQAADAERLQKAYEKYGFTFDEIGAKAQKMQLDLQAKDLIEDWRVLVDSGIDLALVNDKMSAEVNEYLATARRLGIEVPSAWKPILQSMIDQGLLTDDAGVKIQDLEGIGVTFAETLTEGFDRVIEKLDELIAKLTGAAEQIENMPSMPEIPNPRGNTPGGGPPPPAPNPGDDDYEEWRRTHPRGLEPGQVFRPQNSFRGGTGGRYLDFGAGTPVMLHGKERIATEGEAMNDQDLSALTNSIMSLQTVMLRAIRENALGVRDQTLIALGRT